MREDQVSIWDFAQFTAQFFFCLHPPCESRNSASQSEASVLHVTVGKLSCVSVGNQVTEDNCCIATLCTIILNRRRESLKSERSHIMHLSDNMCLSVNSTKLRKRLSFSSFACSTFSEGVCLILATLFFYPHIPNMGFLQEASLDN